MSIRSSSIARKVPGVAARNAIPVIYDRRVFPVAGGSSVTEPILWKPIAIVATMSDGYQGEKPLNLPVLQSTKFEFVINFKPPRRSELNSRPGYWPLRTR